MLFSLSCHTLFGTSQYSVSHVTAMCMKLVLSCLRKASVQVKKCHCSVLQVLQVLQVFQV
jgi:hypothetical protein